MAAAMCAESADLRRGRASAPGDSQRSEEELRKDRHVRVVVQRDACAYKQADIHACSTSELSPALGMHCNDRTRMKPPSAINKGCWTLVHFPTSTHHHPSIHHPSSPLLLLQSNLAVGVCRSNRSGLFSCTAFMHADVRLSVRSEARAAVNAARFCAILRKDERVSSFMHTCMRMYAKCKNHAILACRKYEDAHGKSAIAVDALVANRASGRHWRWGREAELLCAEMQHRTRERVQLFTA
eukprot:1743502-Pleurochrysis_carterae.AAC.2